LFEGNIRMATPTSNRIHALDGLRGAALFLGIMFHAAFSFFSGDAFWMIMDVNRSASVSGLAFVLHIFRMTVFFLLAGYFGRMQLLRAGPAAFAKDRLMRLGIPLFGFWPIAMTAFTGLIIWAIAVQNGGTLPTDLPPPPAITLQTFPLTYLWFLYVLLIFYAGMLLTRAAFGLADRSGWVVNLVDKAIGGSSGLYLTPVVLAIPTGLALYFHPNYLPWFGIPTPENGLLPNLASMVAYGTAFAFGWALHRQSKLLFDLQKSWAPHLFLALALTAYCLSLVGFAPHYTDTLSDMPKIIYFASYALAIWFWTFGLIGAALRFFSRHSPVRRYLADSSYWLYLIHLPIIIALQIWMSQWSLMAEAKYILILAISLPIMLLSYHWLVRFSWLGALLNGKKMPKRKRDQSAN
jgi:peptidoglycan/LPS O-acetylase OafA/YrhL